MCAWLITICFPFLAPFRLAVLAPDDVERSVNVRSDDTIASVAERICSVYQLPSPDQLEIPEYDVNSGTVNGGG